MRCEPVEVSEASSVAASNTSPESASDDCPDASDDCPDTSDASPVNASDASVASSSDAYDNVDTGCAVGPACDI